MPEFIYPDIGRNALAAFGMGRQLRSEDDARKRSQQVNMLSGQAYQAPPEMRDQALGDLAGVDAQAALELGGQLQTDETKRNQALANAARLLVSAPEQYRPAVYERMRAGLSKMIPNLPAQYDNTVAEAAQSIVQAYDPNMSSAAPTGFREFQMKAAAAGLKPGTPEYQRAAAVALGTEGRASNAGFGFEMVKGADGRERPARTNPRTGAYEVFNEETDRFEPMGAPPATAAGGAAPAQGGFGIAETDNYVKSILGKAGNIDPNAAPEAIVAQLMPHLIQQESGGDPNAVSPKGAQGLTQVMPATGRDPGFGVQPMQNGTPQENVRFGRDYLLAMVKRYPGRPDLALAAYNAGPGVADRFAQPSASAGSGALAVGRSPEEQAGLTTSAQEAAKLQFAPQMQAVETQGALERARGEASIKTDAEVGALDAKKIRNARDTLEVLDAVEKLLPNATSGGLGAQRDQALGYFGVGTEGAAATASLKLLSAKLIANVPRFEGPQSNTDVQFYREAAGDLANPALPVATRLAAAKSMRELQQKYADRGQQPAGAAAPASPGAPRVRRYNVQTGRME